MIENNTLLFIILNYATGINDKTKTYIKVDFLFMTTVILQNFVFKILSYL